MQEKDLKVGAILENQLRQFAKIISVKNNVYNLSGWTTKPNAEKATVGYVRINIYGLQNAGVKIVSKGSSKTAPVDDDNDDNDDVTEESLSKMSAKDVKAYAEQIGVDTSGTKKDVIARIIAV